MTLAEKRGVWEKDRHDSRGDRCDCSRDSVEDREASSESGCTVHSRRVSAAHVGRRKDIGRDAPAHLRRLHGTMTSSGY